LLTADGGAGRSANVGDELYLSVRATAADPAALTTTWTSSVDGVGHFGANARAGLTDIVSFTCDAPGATTLTLVLGDGPVPDGGTCPSALSTVTWDITCSAAQDDAGAPDATNGTDATGE
jgi:hypothetical protein